MGRRDAACCHRWTHLLLLVAPVGAFTPIPLCPQIMPIHSLCEQIAGPQDPSKVAEWREAVQDWRSRIRRNLSFTGAIYEVEQLRWTQTAPIEPQMHPYDRFFFDPTLGGPMMGNYTVARWLDDVTARYGGVDSILMWPVAARPVRRLSLLDASFRAARSGDRGNLEQ